MEGRELPLSFKGSFKFSTSVFWPCSTNSILHGFISPLFFSVIVWENRGPPPFMGFWGTSWSWDAPRLDEKLWILPGVSCQSDMPGKLWIEGMQGGILMRYLHQLNWLCLSTCLRLNAAIHVYDLTLPVKAHDYRRVLSSKSKVWPPAQFLLHLKYQVQRLHSCWHCNKLPVDLTLHFTFTQDPEIFKFPHLNQQFTPNANRAIQYFQVHTHVLWNVCYCLPDINSIHKV